MLSRSMPTGSLGSHTSTSPVAPLTVRPRQAWSSMKTEPAAPVERQAVEALVLHPEQPLDGLADDLGAARPFRSRPRIAAGGEPRHDPVGGVGVALHLDQRDRPPGRAPIGVEHGIAGVL